MEETARLYLLLRGLAPCLLTRPQIEDLAAHLGKP